ncbi:hypothetical protein [Haloprofundus salilacus]|nr:hypothetical protein [Haloprofundus salilacus]
MRPRPRLDSEEEQDYYLLVVIDGVEAIEEMSPEEFHDRLDELGLL